MEYSQKEDAHLLMGRLCHSVRRCMCPRSDANDSVHQLICSSELAASAHVHDMRGTFR